MSVIGIFNSKLTGLVCLFSFSRSAARLTDLLFLRFLLEFPLFGLISASLAGSVKGLPLNGADFIKTQRRTWY